MCDEDYNCKELEYDYGDCQIVADCDNQPQSANVVASFLADGMCDDGTYESEESEESDESDNEKPMPNLQCELFEFDEHDCKKPV